MRSDARRRASVSTDGEGVITSKGRKKRKQKEIKPVGRPVYVELASSFRVTGQRLVGDAQRSTTAVDIAGGISVQRSPTRVAFDLDLLLFLFLLPA